MIYLLPAEILQRYRYYQSNTMALPNLLFPLSALLFVAYLAYASHYATQEPAPRRWRAAAGLSAAFLLFTLLTVWVQGPLGFLEEHTRTLWSSQIWLDLLLGVSVALWFMVPPARALGMRVPLWLSLVVLTGNIGLLAMLARIWWLQEQE